MLTIIFIMICSRVSIESGSANAARTAYWYIFAVIVRGRTIVASLGGTLSCSTTNGTAGFQNGTARTAYLRYSIMVATTRVKCLHTTPTFIIHIASIEKIPSDLDSAYKMEQVLYE